MTGKQWHDLLSTVVVETASTVRSAIKWGCPLGIAYFVYLAIASLSGQTTSADIRIGFIASILNDMKKDSIARIALPWGLAVGFGLWAVVERRLRKNHIVGSGETVRRLETRLDPNRSSSHLTQRGETPPEDAA
jgi:hypothetical protein